MSRGRYVDPSWPNPHNAGDADEIIYGFVPSETLCILALTTFGIGLILHSYRLVQYRAWSMLPIAVACVMELAGYSFRLQSAIVDPYRISFFVLNYFFIVVAPVLLSASIYVCLSKMLAWGAAKGFSNPLRLKHRTILLAFVGCDIVATIIQMTGAGLIGHAESIREDPTTPNDILLAGLAFQSASFLTYLIMLASFTISVVRHDFNKTIFMKELGVFSCSLWVTSLLVFARTLFRLAETIEGVFGYAMTHEAFFGSLDFAPIIVATLLLVIWYPPKYLPSHAYSSHDKPEV